VVLAAILAPVRKFVSRQAAPSDSSLAKTCKTSANSRRSSLLRFEFDPSLTPETLPPAPPPPRDRVWLHVVLFLATLLTTTLVGAAHYHAFASDFGLTRVPPDRALLTDGLWYSGTILAILGLHEMGHYVACRYYGINASLPYFIPMPLVMTGTFGAVIRIRSPFRSKRELFDVGVAGPLAGFLVTIPALFIGLSLSRVVPFPTRFEGWNLGEPLLWKVATDLVWGPTAPGYSLNIHPMAFAAWFGMFATALNLIPIGQLDGGHISYAVFGRRSTLITVSALLAVFALTLQSLVWVSWAIILTVMLLVVGPRHPRTPDEDVPLDRSRLVVAALAVTILALCFTPAPIEPLELIGGMPTD